MPAVRRMNLHSAQQPDKAASEPFIVVRHENKVSWCLLGSFIYFIHFFFILLTDVSLDIVVHIYYVFSVCHKIYVFM